MKDSHGVLDEAEKARVLELEQRFRVSSDLGFLGPLPPVQSLGHLERFRSVEQTISALPQLLCAGKVRETMWKMEENYFEWQVENLTRDELERLFLVLAMLTHAFVWEDQIYAPPKNLDHDAIKRDEKELVLPHEFANILLKTAQILDRPPVLSHGSLVLRNWHYLDQNNSNDVCFLTSCGISNCFLGGADEQWFYIITAELERVGGKALSAMIAIKTLMERNLQTSARDIEIFMREILDSQKEMLCVLKRMREKCDPYIFFKRIRPFLSGWKNNPMHPRGIRYGKSGPLLLLYGGSAAQSSLIPAFDAFFSVDHSQSNSAHASYLLEMRNYMPLEHRAFLEYLEQPPHLRDSVHFKDAQVFELFREGLLSLKRFRDLHIQLVAEYIIAQKPRHSALSDSSSGKGTGGTVIMPFLKDVRDDVVIPNK